MLPSDIATSPTEICNLKVANELVGEFLPEKV